MVFMAKKGPGRPKSEQRKEREGIPLNVWLSVALTAAFEESRTKARRTKRAHLEAILEDFLRREGLWPPTKPEGQQ